MKLNLKKICDVTGKTQEEIAEQLNISSRMLLKYQEGLSMRKFEFVKKLLSMSNLKFNEIFIEDEKPPI